MLNSIPLKCPNCGANLEITTEMTTFACGYCGASQIVERAGGTIALKLLSEGIAKVQAGTDKTAAELAIRRLKEDYEQVQSDYNQLIFKQNKRWYEISQPFKVFGAISAFFLFLGLLGAFSGGGAGILLSIVCVLFLGGLIYFYYALQTKHTIKSGIARRPYQHELNTILERIKENKKIVGY